MSDIESNPRGIPCKTVDVFTDTPFRGNPVAVVLDATGLSAERMQQIANWTNLSETTFVVPVTAAGADYHVRIFTPGTELPFAGHPTIGTAHALLEAGIVEATNGELVQQCGAGLVRLRVGVSSGNTRNIAFTLPPPAFSPLSQAQYGELQAILHTALEDGTRPCLVDVGARWVVAMLPSARAVLEAEPDLGRMKQMNIAGGHTGGVIFGRHGPDAGSEIEVRAFAPAHGVDEDLVCGSGNGCVAAYIRHTGKNAGFGAEFLATQGNVLGRAGKLRLSIAPDAIEVDGSVVTCMDGVLRR